MRRHLIASVAAALTIAVSAPVVQAAPAPLAGSADVPGSSAYLDDLGRPTPELQNQIKAVANAPHMPEHIRNALLTGLAFTAGTGETGGPGLPEHGPGFTQFYWPTVSGGCIDGRGDAVASAIAVPGPAEIPAPGARDGQTTFLFTALGTKPAAERQGGMFVHWFNMDTLKFGTTPLGNHGINPEGPATVSGVADTGKGTILAVATGQLRTTTTTCGFVPTVAKIEAR